MYTKKTQYLHLICLDNSISSNNIVVQNICRKYDIESYKNITIEYLNIDIVEIDIFFIKRKLDLIIHLACIASPKLYQANAIKTLDTCYIGTKNILDIAKKNNARIVFTSTSEIYGNPLIDIQNETYNGNVSTTGPRACYDEGKRVAETLCYEYRQKYGINVGIVRLFNSYGKYMNINDTHVIPQFILQAVNNRDITIYGDGSQTRSFCHINDLVEGLWRMCKINHFGPVNLGNDETYSIKHVADSIKKIANSSSNIIYLELPQDDPIKRKPCIKLANKILDWKPIISLEEGLKQTIDYLLL